MAVKTVEIDGVGPVTLYKRKGSRTIRLSIAHDGQVKATLPSWAPYSAAIAFVRAKADWITIQKPRPKLVQQGHPVGKAHHIHFDTGTGKGVSTRVTGNQARVILPPGVRWDSVSSQEAAQKVALRVLKKEAATLLPFRLQTLAKEHDYTYNSVSIKRLSGRWGSCSDNKDIVLNCYLMQLPWELIDYVLLHELAHTRVMQHGPPFWAEMSKSITDLASRRKVIKEYKPVL